MCLQKIKLSVIDGLLIANMIGPNFGYDVVPTIGTCGGIFVAWRSHHWSDTHFHQTSHALTLKLSNLVTSSP
jgi:hypothetical protein